MVTELKRTGSSLDHIEELLGSNARTLLDHNTQHKDDFKRRFALARSGLY